MFDVVCIGNALIDSFLDTSGLSSNIRLDAKSGELRLKLGEKIPIESAQFELGGNACNVSVGLSRLGLKTSLIAEIGDDAFSSRIRKSLEGEKVNLTNFIVSHGPASFAVGINYKADRLLFVHHVERSHNFNYHGMKTTWIYLSSMGEKWRHVYRDVVYLVKHENIKLAVNPGTRQILTGREILDPVLACTEVLFLNKEEAEKLVHNKKQISKDSNHEHIKNLCIKLQKLGAKTVAITDGRRGSFTLDVDGKFYHQNIIDVDVVEKTGAGDSFASGFISAVYLGYDIQTALRWGSVNAASVIGKIGAQKGLLTKEQILKKL